MRPRRDRNRFATPIAQHPDHMFARNADVIVDRRDPHLGIAGDERIDDRLMRAGDLLRIVIELADDDKTKAQLCRQLIINAQQPLGSGQFADEAMEAEVSLHLRKRIADMRVDLGGVARSRSAISGVNRSMTRRPAWRSRHMRKS